MGRSLIATEPCQICGDRSFGRHYGLWTCDGCSCFFKRSIRRNIQYTCISGENNCPVDKTRRNWCPACRLRKCLSMEMNVNAVQKERGPRQKKHDITEVGLKFGKNKLEKAANAEEGPKTKDSNSVGVDLPLTEAKIDFNTVNTVSPLLAMGWPLGGGNMAGFALDATLIAALTNASKSSVIVFQSAEVKSIILNKLWPLIFTLHVAQTPNIYAAIAFDALDSGIRKTITTHLNTDGELVPDVEEVRLLICLLFCLHGNGQTPELAYAASLSDTYRFWLARHCANFYATEESRFGRLIDFVEAVSAIDLDGLQLLRLNFKLDPATIIACFTAGAEVNKI